MLLNVVVVVRLVLHQA